jgi:AcrR family transcriptional regulator
MRENGLVSIKRTSSRTASAAKPTPAGRREQILATAAEVFARQGYHATTVREIADGAGMLAGSLYYHFDSKEAMVDEILSTFLRDLWDGYQSVLEAGRGPRETLEALVRESFRQIDRHGDAVAIYQRERGLAEEPRFSYLNESQERFEAAWLGTLERGVSEGALRADLDVRLAYRFLRDTVWVAASWYRPGGRLTASQLADRYLSMVLEGVTPRE